MLVNDCIWVPLVYVFVLVVLWHWVVNVVGLRRRGGNEGGAPKERKHGGGSSRSISGVAISCALVL